MHEGGEVDEEMGEGSTFDVSRGGGGGERGGGRGEGGN